MMVSLIISALAFVALSSLFVWQEYTQGKKIRDNEARLAELALIVEKHERILGLAERKKAQASAPIHIARRELRGKQ
jgi:Tfp pilus assembly protein PilE